MSCKKRKVVSFMGHTRKRVRIKFSAKDCGRSKGGGRK